MGQPIVPPPVPSSSTGMPQQSRLAIASMVFGILSFCCLGPFGSIPAIIMGIIALVKIGNAQAPLQGKGWAVAGLVMGCVSFFLFIIVVPISLAILLPALARAREAARRSACQGNLKQMGLVYKMFANESKGNYFPELSSEAGRLMCVSKEIFPDYLTDAGILICPSDANLTASEQSDLVNETMIIDKVSYTYLGYVIMSDDEMEAFAEVYKQRVAQKLPFNEDLDAPPGRGSMGTNKFYRLREGVERELLNDPNNTSSAAKLLSEIPIMWDMITAGQQGALFFNHVPGGANVLFMDGHVEFRRYPGEWPVSRRSAEILSGLTTMKP
ncbi:MAG TPA: DUF4190 domain-containing protein [Candidatus Hydrogenedentes bacterium]|nr:DUF4190 domain-containing protein [Candidatus Hydrogenedentota bacterium]